MEGRLECTYSLIALVLDSGLDLGALGMPCYATNPGLN